MFRSSFAVKMLLTYVVGTLAVAFLGDLLLSSRLEASYATAGLTPEQINPHILELRTTFWFCALAWLALSLVFSRAYLKRLETILSRWRRMQRKFEKSAPDAGKNDELDRMDRWISRMSSDLERKIVELTEERNQLKTTLDTLREGVMVLSREGKILVLNRSLKDLLKLNDSALGKPPIEVIRNADLQGIVERCLEGEKLLSEEIELVQDEHEKTLSIQATSLKEIAPQLGAIVAIDDMTALRQLEKVRRDFVANLSHELKTPLTSIQGYVETLMDGGLQDQRSAGNFLQIIESNARRMSRLIEGLLRLSEIESQRWILKPEAIELSFFLDEIARLFEIQLQKKGMKIRVESDPSLTTIHTDKLTLTQILTNLIDNAIKYGGPDTTIRLRGAKRGAFLRLEVEDEGIGIEKHHLDRIFERFYRVDASRSRAGESTGLGLSIARHLVQLLGGRIEVKSEIQKGSVFSFEIPLNSEVAAARRHP